MSSGWSGSSSREMLSGFQLVIYELCIQKLESYFQIAQANALSKQTSCIFYQIFALIAFTTLSQNTDCCFSLSKFRIPFLFDLLCENNFKSETECHWAYHNNKSNSDKHSCFSYSDELMSIIGIILYHMKSNSVVNKFL